jgi:hypothetical protein
MLNRCNFDLMVLFSFVIKVFYPRSCFGISPAVPAESKQELYELLFGWIRLGREKMR